MKTTKTILTLAMSTLLLPLAQAQEVIREKTVQDFPAGEVAAVRTQPIEVTGLVTQYGEGAIAVRAESAATPIQYHFAKTTQWVDESGNVVTRETVRAGQPVTLFYTRSPEGLLVSKVVVRRQTVTAPAVEAERTTTVERHEPIAEGPAPRTVERREIIKERPAPRVIEKPTIVERPAPPLVEKKTTTTTTTTTDKKKKHDDDDDDD
jgi:hypothetical protein